MIAFVQLNQARENSKDAKDYNRLLLEAVLDLKPDDSEELIKTLSEVNASQDVVEQRINDLQNMIRDLGRVKEQLSSLEQEKLSALGEQGEVTAENSYPPQVLSVDPLIFDNEERRALESAAPADALIVIRNGLADIEEQLAQAQVEKAKLLNASTQLSEAKSNLNVTINDNEVRQSAFQRCQADLSGDMLAKVIVENTLTVRDAPYNFLKGGRGDIVSYVSSGDKVKIQAPDFDGGDFSSKNFFTGTEWLSIQYCTPQGNLKYGWVGKETESGSNTLCKLKDNSSLPMLNLCD